MKSVAIALVYVLLFSCVDDYTYPFESNNQRYLVVEGFINPGGVTSIRLTRSLALEDASAKLVYEKKASVTIEGSDDSKILLTEVSDGLYHAPTASINQDLKYRIHINVQDKNEYLSEFVKVKKTQPIDSLVMEVDGAKRGIQFYVFTHDAMDSSRFYHWDYKETWQYHAVYRTSLEYKNNQVDYKDPGAIDTYDCWMTRESTRIFAFSTQRLKQDLVYKYPLQFVSAHSEVFEIGYKLQVNQYAVTEEEFNYLEQLRKNTETNGSIFDPTPSMLTGNITCSNDPSLPVLGYIGAHNVTTKTIAFITGGKLPPYFDGAYYTPSCTGDVPDYIIREGIKTGAFVPKGYTPDKYSWVQIQCVDCRVRGGTNIKPADWPN